MISVGLRLGGPVLLAVALGAAVAAGAERSAILSDLLGAGHGVALAPAQREAARALGRAIAALEENDLRAAGRAIEQARRAAPIADHVALHEARLLIARGDASRAAELARAARAAHPDSPLQADFARLAGTALAAAGAEAEAQVALHEALSLTANAAAKREIRLAIVASRQRSGELDRTADPEALLAREFPVSHALTPERRTAKMALLAAEDRVAIGHSAAAIDAYREAIAKGLSGAELRRARLGLGIARFRLRRYTEALPTFEMMGRDPEGRFWRARSLARLGRIEEAIIGFEALVGGRDPDIASRSAYLAATLLEDRGKQQRALAHYARVAQDTADPERALDALWRIGWSAWKRGEYAKARDRFAEMVARTPDESDALRARYWEARAAGEAGDDAGARAALQSLARDWPLSYYGWRAQQRLGAIDPAAAAAAGRGPTRTTLPDASVERVALLLEASLDEAAREELADLRRAVRTRADHERIGRLFVAAGDYHAAQRLVVDAYGVPLAKGVRPGDETLLWLSWPPAYRDLVTRSLPGSGRVDPALVWAIMREESSFRPEVMSSAGAMGLLQLMPETARRQAKRSGIRPIRADEELFRPDTNISLGSAYLDYLASRFPDRVSATIGSYNAGPNAVARWLRGEAGRWDDDVWVEEIPYGQTRSYVKRVLRSLHVYKTFY